VKYSPAEPVSSTVSHSIWISSKLLDLQWTTLTSAKAGAALNTQWATQVHMPCLCLNSPIQHIGGLRPQWVNHIDSQFATCYHQCMNKHTYRRLQRITLPRAGCLMLVGTLCLLFGWSIHSIPANGVYTSAVFESLAKAMRRLILRGWSVTDEPLQRCNSQALRLNAGQMLLGEHTVHTAVGCTVWHMMIHVPCSCLCCVRQWPLTYWTQI